jgi:hypothetical protein
MEVFDHEVAGVLHEVGFALSFVGAIAACGVFARRYASPGRAAATTVGGGLGHRRLA